MGQSPCSGSPAPSVKKGADSEGVRVVREPACRETGFSATQRRVPPLSSGPMLCAWSRTQRCPEVLASPRAPWCLLHGTVTVHPCLGLRKRRPRVDRLGQDPQDGEGRARHEPGNVQVKRPLPRAPQLRSREQGRPLGFAAGEVWPSATFLPPASFALAPPRFQAKSEKHPQAGERRTGYWMGGWLQCCPRQSPPLM